MFDDTDIKGRDNFLAFAGDAASREALTDLAEARGWSAERIVSGGVDEAIAGLAGMATPELLVVDLGAAPDPAAAVDRLAEVCDPGTRVIAFGDVNDVALYRELMEIGIGDYLVKPVTATVLAAALDRLAARHAPVPADMAPAPAATECGRVIGVIGARGGAGATTVAVNCAWIMAHEFEQRTALVDLDLHFGTAALALDLEPGRGLGEALQAPDRIDDLFLERAAVKESDRLAVLAAEEPLNRPVSGSAAAFDTLFDRLRTSFERVVVDIPRGMIGSRPEIMGVADTFVLVGERSLAGLRDSIVISQALTEAAAGKRIVTVVNRAGAISKAEIGRADFEKSLGRPVDHVIPYDAKGAAAASVKGRALVQAARRLPAAKALAVVARDMADLGESAPGGLFARMGASKKAA